MTILHSYNNNPNLTILLPGGCNAHCEFCFWKQDSSRNGLRNYLKVLRKNFINLPRNLFTQLSLSGGEPTISPAWDNIMEIIDTFRDQYQKVVLTSNGVKLLEKLSNPIFHERIDHINISRHHYEDAANFVKFGTDSVPDSTKLVAIVNAANKQGIDINFNCVLDNNIDDENFVYEYIRFAKMMGASSIAFRKQHSALGKHPLLEKMSQEYKIVSSGGCPVCESHSQLILGMPVTWKSSVMEPTDVFPKDTFYEFIFQQNGELTSDWEGKKKIYTGFNLDTNESYFSDIPNEEIRGVPEIPANHHVEEIVGCHGTERKVLVENINQAFIGLRSGASMRFNGKVYRGNDISVLPPAPKGFSYQKELGNWGNCGAGFEEYEVTLIKNSPAHIPNHNHNYNPNQIPDGYTISFTTSKGCSGVETKHACLVKGVGKNNNVPRGYEVRGKVGSEPSLFYVGLKNTKAVKSPKEISSEVYECYSKSYGGGCH